MDSEAVRGGAGGGLAQTLAALTRQLAARAADPIGHTHAVQALNVMASDEANRAEIVSSAAMPLLLDAIEAVQAPAAAPPGYEEQAVLLRAKALRALGSLASTPALRSRLAELGAVSAVCRALQPPTHARIRTNATFALAQLLLDAHLAKGLGTDVLPPLVELLRTGSETDQARARARERAACARGAAGGGGRPHRPARAPSFFYARNVPARCAAGRGARAAPHAQPPSPSLKPYIHPTPLPTPPRARAPRPLRR